MRRVHLYFITVWCAVAFAVRYGSAESLADAWALALAKNDQLAASQLQETAAQYDLDATWAERMPNAWLHSAYSLRSDKSSFKFHDPTPGSGTLRFPYLQREAARVGAHVRVPVYTSGRITNSIQSARARLAAEQHDVAMAKNDLMLAVGESYLAVLRAQRELQVAEENLASLTAHETNMHDFFAQQRVPHNDLLAAQVTTASARQVRLHTLQALGITCGRYNRLLGRPLVSPVQLEELALPTMGQRLEELKLLAWKERPDLLRIRASANARQFESDRMRAAGLPQVSLVGSYEYEENRYRSPEALATASVVVDWNFLDRRRKSRVAAEMTRVASLNRRVEDLRSRIDLELLTAWNDRHTATEHLKVASHSLQHADESLRISRLRFSRGMAVSSDVLDAQSQRTQVERDYFNAAYDRTLAQLRLRYASGVLGNGY